MPEFDSDDFIMLPKVDFAFKEMMANANVRKGFLSAVLNIKDTDIKETTIANPNMSGGNADEKLSILDVRVLMNSSTEIDIEIQLGYYGTWAERSTFYITKMLTEQSDINKTYSNMKKCIGINILDFKYTKDDRYYKSYHIREDTTNEKFTDILEWHIIELPKLPSESSGDNLYKWARFIKAVSKEEMEMIAQTDRYIAEAYKELEKISRDKLKKIEYTSRQKAIMDHNTIMEERYETGMHEGIQIGKEEGRKEGRKEGRAEGMAEKETQLIIKWREQGKSEEEIFELLN